MFCKRGTSLRKCCTQRQRSSEAESVCNFNSERFSQHRQGEVFLSSATN
jgi:hypothetical protein